MHTVKIWLNPTSQPIIYKNVTNTYTKDGLFCVYQESENTVTKYPVMALFRVEETYYPA